MTHFRQLPRRKQCGRAHSLTYHGYRPVRKVGTPGQNKHLPRHATVVLSLIIYKEPYKAMSNRLYIRHDSTEDLLFMVILTRILLENVATAVCEKSKKNLKVFQK